MSYIGYARVSTFDQNLSMQNDALNKVGCLKIFEDYASGAKTERKGLIAALEYLRKGDTLVVWKLDRLGRSMKDLITTVLGLKEKGIEFISLQENIDTSSSTGKLIFHMFASLAEFERDIIRERTKAGLSSARARGRIGGRPRKLNEDQIRQLQVLYQESKTPISSILSTFRIKKTTFYEYLKSIKPKIVKLEI